MDRAGLDMAIGLGLDHGGWCPRGRLAEDGAIPALYQLRETDSPLYAVRTEQNVIDSDATLILYLEPLEGGTELTRPAGQAARSPVPADRPRAAAAGRYGPAVDSRDGCSGAEHRRPPRKPASGHLSAGARVSRTGFFRGGKLTATLSCGERAPARQPAAGYSQCFAGRTTSSQSQQSAGNCLEAFSGSVMAARRETRPVRDSSLAAVDHCDRRLRR